MAKARATNRHRSVSPGAALADAPDPGPVLAPVPGLAPVLGCEIGGTGGPAPAASSGATVLPWPGNGPPAASLGAASLGAPVPPPPGRQPGVPQPGAPADGGTVVSPAAAGALLTTGTVPVVAAGATVVRQAVGASPSLHARLDAYRPLGVPAHVVALYGPVLVHAVLNTRTWRSPAPALAHLSALWGLVRVWLLTHPVLDLRLALRDTQQYVQTAFARSSVGCRSTIRSRLVPVLYANWPNEPALHLPPIGRTKVLNFFTPEEKAERYRNVEVLPASLRADAYALYDLTFGAGLPRGEVAAATAEWIVDGGDEGVTVIARDQKDKVRHIPVSADVGRRLVQRAAEVGPGGWLLRPHAANRAATTEYFVQRLNEEGRGRGRHFKVSFARSAWLIDMLARKIPYPVVVDMAGLSAGTQTAHDLLAYIPRPRDPQAIVRKALR